MKTTILIVNDSPDQLRALDSWLSASGYTVVTAANGQDGMAAARQHLPTLILSDVVMPVMDGIALCRAVRADAALRTMPILLVSGIRRDSATAVAALEAGADDYIELPCEPMRLAAKVAQQIERTRAAERMRVQLDFTRAITISLGEGLYALDSNGRVTFMNPAAERMLGWRETELLGRVAHEIVHFQREDGSHMSAADCPLQQVLVSGVMVSIDTDVFTRRDGSTFPVAYTSSPLVSEGRVTGAVVAFQDVTERRRAAQALQRSEARYRDLVENARAVIYSHDLRGNILSINSYAERLTGYRRDELLHMNISELVVTDQLDRVHAAIGEILAGDTTTEYEVDVMTVDGRRISVEVTARIVQHDDAPAIIYGIVRDVTARKELETSFRHAQKMEAVGQLACGIAHDFNNVLTTVLCFADLVREQIGAAHPATPDLIEIEKAGERGAALTQQLLAFSRRQVLTPRVVDINAVVDELAPMLDRLLGEDVELVLRRGRGVGRVKADRGQFEQVIMNLAVNARDAMPEGGQLTIETKAAPGPNGAGQLAIVVSDTGVGMDEVTRARVFEPFFTTKEVGKGTGLGLSTVAGIVEQSGGHIAVESRLGEGTRFTVTLPCTSEREERAPAARPRLEGCAPATILLVEDDPSVRKLVRGMLQSTGHSVLEATDGDAALSIAAEHGREIDLLISDLVLPRKSGRHVAEALTATHPRLKVIYMSGYTDDALMHRGLAATAGAFVQKPFTKELLLAAVAATLGVKCAA